MTVRLHAICHALASDKKLALLFLALDPPPLIDDLNSFMFNKPERADLLQKILALLVYDILMKSYLLKKNECLYYKVYNSNSCFLGFFLLIILYS